MIILHYTVKFQASLGYKTPCLIKSKQIKRPVINEPGVVGHACDPGALEDKARGLTASSRPTGLHINSVTNKQKFNQENKQE